MSRYLDPLANERVYRVRDLMREAAGIVDEAYRTYFMDGAIRVNRRELAGKVCLFSGGNDSTVLAHLFRHDVTHYGHANTGIGVEATRQFVRDTCAWWNVPLLEKHPPEGSRYRDMVLAEGFPGPAKHWKMYQRLKLRCIEQMQKDLITNPYRQRVMFLAGRRLTESERRQRRLIPRYERNKSAVWVSPLINWTKLDLNTYRAMHPEVPTNPVADILHMSGECACGAFAEPDEIELFRMVAPDLVEEIECLEREVSALGTVPPERCRWGWGAYRDRSKSVDVKPVGPLCQSCELKQPA